MELTIGDSSELKFKQSFEETLHDYDIHHQGSLRKPWTKDRILEVISKVKEARESMTNTECRTSMSYYWLSKYDVIISGSEECLIFKRKGPEDPVIRIIPREDYFSILNTIHKDCGHGGRDKMTFNVKSRYYIAKKAIEIFVSLCPLCNTKRNISRKSVVTQPIQDFNIRGQVDLIDFQSCPDGEYKWLLIYQDIGTNFLNIRPLKSKMATEVALELMKIFLIFDPPYILQSDNGREFTLKVIEELVAMWPDCKIVYGSQWRPQTQVSIERRYQHVENMIHSWMLDNNSTNWSIGCYFCQYQINVSFHQTIGRSPYKALFGCEPKAGLNGTNIPSQLLLNVKTENQLNNLKNEPDDGIDVSYQILKNHSNAVVISEENHGNNIKTEPGKTECDIE